MNDDKIRELLRDAHALDRPPPFAVPERRRNLKAFTFAASLAILALVAIAYIVSGKPPRRIDVAMPAIHYPTDFLLPKPGLDVPEPTKGLLQ